MDTLSITLTIIGLIVTVGIAILKRIRDGDLNHLNLLKEEFEGKLADLTKQTDRVYTSIQAKLDKEDHIRTLERLDKELASIRENQKHDLTRIEIKIDRVLDMIIKRNHE